jgi:molybdopterin converting factor small subunit
MSVRIIAEDMLPSHEAQLEAGTVGEAAEAVGLARRTGLVILVNGRLADWKTALVDGDTVEFIPALGGG